MTRRTVVLCKSGTPSLQSLSRCLAIIFDAKRHFAQLYSHVVTTVIVLLSGGLGLIAMRWTASSCGRNLVRHFVQNINPVLNCGRTGELEEPMIEFVGGFEKVVTYF